jgi:hypothetical protein
VFIAPEDRVLVASRKDVMMCDDVHGLIMCKRDYGRLYQKSGTSWEFAMAWRWFGIFSRQMDGRMFVPSRLELRCRCGVYPEN